MDTSESGDDLGNNFLAVETQNFMVHAEELDAENTDDSNQGGGDKIGYPLREQDRFLPIANIAKIMKRGIPEPGKIAKDARECVQECVSEFISFITSEASDRCHMEKRKTINGEDILFAMTTLGFDNYVEPLKLYLQKYREWSMDPVNMPNHQPHIHTSPGSSCNIGNKMALQHVIRSLGPEATKVEKPMIAEMYEEILPDESFNAQTLQGNIITSDQNGGGETVIYTYPEQIQQFQLS